MKKILIIVAIIILGIVAASVYQFNSTNDDTDIKRDSDNSAASDNEPPLTYEEVQRLMQEDGIQTGDMQPEQLQDPAHTQIPNPASVHCLEQGGSLEMLSDDSGGQHGICIFPNGSTCEEWAFFRGECSPEE